MKLPKFDILSFNYNTKMYYNTIVIHQTFLNADIKLNKSEGEV